MPASLRYVFTLHVELADPVQFGVTTSGERRFIGITGGHFEGPGIKGNILPGGGDWNSVKDGIVHVYARYSLRTHDGVPISITNEGFGRAAPGQMEHVFANDFEEAEKKSSGDTWYTKTWPRFEVAAGSSYEWLNRSCFVGDLLKPDQPSHVKIEVYEVL